MSTFKQFGVKRKKSKQDILNICTLQLPPSTYALIKYHLFRNTKHF